MPCRLPAITPYWILCASLQGARFTLEPIYGAIFPPTVHEEGVSSETVPFSCCLNWFFFLFLLYTSCASLQLPQN